MKKQGLPKNAYEIKEGEVYRPLMYDRKLPEFTIKAVISGAILGVLFGAANTYLGLKAGLTISTSIPVAVLTVVLFQSFKVFGVKHNILEANMSQTIGSASSSVASGVLFTIPALFLWGMSPKLVQISLLAMSGGLIGVLSMIPLRRYLIKKEHGKLPYPEGMACAEVLVTAESGGKGGSGIFWGIGVGMLFKVMTGGFKLVADKFQLALGYKSSLAAGTTSLYKADLAIGVSPALMGVGYILGVRVAAVMVSGAALSAFVIIPLINYWGSGLDTPFYPETDKIIRNMTPHDIWNKYIRYIGAGAVATGGLITLIKSIPTMIESFKLSIGQMKANRESQAAIERTDNDLSLKWVFFIVGIVLLVLTFVPGILGFMDSIIVRGLASIMIAIFAFFFVTVSSRIVGLVGVTSNPTSGMTIATLLGTSVIFWACGWTGDFGKATALMVGTSVCIAASIAGDTSQDLKTGFILGATPKFQQVGELVGVITSATFVCLTVLLLHKYIEGGIGGSELPAPQATLMNLVISGVLDQNLPWTLILIGVGIAIVAFLLRLPVLAFAVGVYLPLSTMAPVFLGGFMRHLLMKRKSAERVDEVREQGVLFGSGLVGGEGLMGVGLALWVACTGGKRIEGLPAWLAEKGVTLPLSEGALEVLVQVIAALGILCILGAIYKVATRKLNQA